MASYDLVIHAGWVIPVNDSVSDTTEVLADHAIAVSGGRIAAIAPSAQAQSWQAIQTVQRPGHVLIPGLINAHTHAAMSLLRGLADDLPLMDWLNDHIWPAEGQWVSEDFCADGVELAVAEMLKCGVTCFNDMYFFPDVTAKVALEKGMRASVGMIFIDFPSAWAGSADEYLSKGLALHDQYRNHPLISTVFAPHAPYTVNDQALQRIQTLADELDVRVHIHVHETAFEVEQSQAEHGQRPLARLKQLGLMSANLLAVHMTQLQEEEIVALAEAGVHVVHCPESNLKLASGFCPVAKLQAAGVNVALGTDGAASNNDLDLLAEMQTAAQLAKTVAGDASVVPAAQALHMATLGGAQALGLADETGSLEVGKWADMVTVDLGDISTQPVYNPLSQLVYSASREQVKDVWVAGKCLLSERQLTTIDEAAVLRKAAAWQQKIAAGANS